MDNDNDRNPPEELDRLSRAIIEAIMASDKVKHALARIRDENIKLDNSHMVLVLNMKGIPHGDESPIEETAEAGRTRKKDFRYQVDGRELSKNEIRFYEHEATKFNENEWLKSIKISVETD